MPDTLDLARRAELAIHGITNMLDPTRDYLMFDIAWFNRKPPVITLLWPEEILSCGNKHLEALPLLRIMSGALLNIEIDHGFLQSTLNMTASDGCMYFPPKKRALSSKRSGPFPVPYASVQGEGRNIWLSLCGTSTTRIHFGEG